MNLLDVDFKKKFALMPYVKLGCGGCVPLAISTVKFSDFDDMIKSANISLKYASMDYNATKNGINTKDASNANRFFHLKHAILDYSACYDYCLLMVFFAFGFCGQISSDKDYKEALRKCRFKSSSNNNQVFAIYDALNTLSLNNVYATELLNRLDALMKDRDRLAMWANAIKHRGNIYHLGLEPIFPEIAYTTSKFYFNEEGVIQFTDGNKLSLSDIINPQIISNEEGINELIKHNKILCEFANWLYDFVGFTKVESSKDMTVAFIDIRPFIYKDLTNMSNCEYLL